MFSSNPDYVACEKGLKRLEEMRADGTDESPEADALRAAMDERWTRLAAEERRRLTGLSTDLDSLSGDEPVIP